jgi:hypothetical protein
MDWERVFFFLITRNTSTKNAFPNEFFFFLIEIRSCDFAKL